MMSGLSLTGPEHWAEMLAKDCLPPTAEDWLPTALRWTALWVNRNLADQKTENRRCLEAWTSATRWLLTAPHY